MIEQDFPALHPLSDPDKAKFFGAVGLAVRARGCLTGTELCVEAMRKNKGVLLAAACDISDNTKKRLFGTARSHGIAYTYLGVSKSELAHIAGKKSDTAAVLFTDCGFVKILDKLENPLTIYTNDNYTHLTNTEVLDR